MLAAIDARIDFSDNEDVTGTANEDDAVDERGAAVEPLTLMPMHRLLPIALTKGEMSADAVDDHCNSPERSNEVDPPRTVVKCQHALLSFPKIVTASSH